ncbi:MAG: SDR family NAD(P)-dependent oxidoreductase [Rhodospirillaceae bacterium]|jgi:NAD(P)-dependent dehydrogenase (short-subunit alcohol dehydrogenase family)|nr:SDR family NAD(P)-dependent oxidoreductase [Rhodospirillaceae bacterium]MBT3493069.1 SDR family NAD(P)-dependent oxidoreductase [Rhodospirillaceae bacterium]MBT3779446.1 SDR family NAD(P)-dependent oxidoreductase [Rhodospirillaceae bacterium]MBT3977163.1 SDR family NAD(P)-dependent oxidoreductase [Rhodospirillaceae bacterium]MBT4171307.1 SDR family NAD(P)-dependent oxidoreductase [Rhodospirillaceae bacterium]
MTTANASRAAKPEDDTGPTPRPLTGRHALITGGNRGIGAAIARELADLGANITLAARDEAALQEQSQALSQRGDTAVACQTMDLRDAASITRGVAAARDELGPISILINNAGVAPAAPLAKLQLDSWRETFEINVQAAFLLSQAVLDDMQTQGFGRMINISSTAGLRGYPFVAAYVASKHALIGLTRALALELSKGPITVNAVCPGYAETEMAHNAIRNIQQSGKTEAEARAILTRGNPQGRLIQPDEVAATVGWLCQPSSASITGQAIAVAGGEVM